MDHESLKPDTEDAGRQPPEGPVLCKKGCGFFATASTLYFCSKCYKEHVKEQARDVAPTATTIATTATTGAGVLPESSTLGVAGDIVKGDAASTADSTTTSIIPTISTTPMEQGGSSVSAAGVALAAQAAAPAAVSGLVLSQSQQVLAKPGRCHSCNKRVGYTGFKCRCGQVFCSMHRHSDQHECPIDYRTEGQAAIAKANPVIKADKLDRI